MGGGTAMGGRPDLQEEMRMPKSQRPDGTVAGSTKRLTSRIYQLKTGHCLTGQCLHWTKNRPTAQCWWCRYRTQTRDHLFKECPEWKPQQKILWEQVLKETERGEEPVEVLADGRCSRAVLDILSTDVGRRVPTEEDAGSTGSAGSGKRRGGRRRKSWGLRKSCRFSFPRPLSWQIPRESTRGRVSFPFVLSWARIPFLCDPFGAQPFSWDRPGRRIKRACNGPPHADSGQEADCIVCSYIFAMIYLGCMPIVVGQKKITNGPRGHSPPYRPWPQITSCTLESLRAQNIVSSRVCT